MKIISHRGNLDGPNSIYENSFNRIVDILDSTDYHIEVDIWHMQDTMFYIGHDNPYSIDKPHVLGADHRFEFKQDHDYSRIIFHAKDLVTYEKLYNISSELDIQYFCHDKDYLGLLNTGVHWSCKEMDTLEMRQNTILVINENNIANYCDLTDYYGVCTDYPIELQRRLASNTL